MGEPARRIPLFERLQIESQSNCNRSCWFCPRTYDRSGRYLTASGEPVLQQMPTEKILDLLDQAQALGFRGRVSFHHYSEPLLDRRNIALAREARARGMEPYLHTNGDVLLRNPALRREVLDTYRVIVVGLYDYDSEAELEQAKQEWRERLRPDIDFSAIGRSGIRSGRSMGVPRALVPPDDRMAAPDVVFSGAPCHRPLVRLTVQYDGEMCLCCEDTHGAFRLGNAYRETIEALWFSERHVGMVEDLIAGHRDRYPLCRQCPMPPTARAAPGQTVRISRRRSVAAAAID